MKIARIETFLFDPGTARNLLFCRVETDSEEFPRKNYTVAATRTGF